MPTIFEENAYIKNPENRATAGSELSTHAYKGGVTVEAEVIGLNSTES